MACFFITRANPFPVVLVDCSQLRYMTLRASVSVKGRSVTFYEQAFECKNYNSPESHQHFLDNPEFLGESQLAKRSPLKCFAYLYKNHSKGRKAHRHSRTCQKHSAGKVFHKGVKKLWLQVTKTPNHVLSGIKITRLYAKKMLIEESFRDLKMLPTGWPSIITEHVTPSELISCYLWH
ncbi:hypothetical protein [Vibrio fortis]|uniref:hypothetical protein n=1 Tax=Vibrio fortis TaxID=212667 RepID=UPI0038CD87C6